jgi:hypothetical protein
MRFGKSTIAVALLTVVVTCVAGLCMAVPSNAGAIEAPTTTASLAPQPDAAGWNTAPVTVTLTATDPYDKLSGAPDDLDGVLVTVATYYKFGGSGDYAGYTPYDPAAKPVVSTEGSTLVWFYSAGLITSPPGELDSTPSFVETPKSVTVNLDMTAPVTTAVLDPAPNAKGVNTSPVTVTLNATDALSGVSKTYYRLGATGDYSEYAGPFSIATEGTTEVFYYSTDKAGNVEAAKHTAVIVDLTPPAPKPVSGYSTVQVGRGHWATIAFIVRDPLSSSVWTKLQIRSGGHTVKTLDLGKVATNKRVAARFRCYLGTGVYRYRIVATASSGLTGQYVKGYLAVGSAPTALIQGAAGVQSGGMVSLRYLLIDPFAKSAHLKLQIMEPATTGTHKTNSVVKSIDLGTRATNVVGVATFRCTVKPGLYRWAFAAQDGFGIDLRTTSNLVWVR